MDAVTPTTMMAVAGLCFALYSNYKTKQTRIEGLMLLLMTADNTPDLIRKIIRELGHIDLGFDFDDYFSNDNGDKTSGGQID